MTAHRPWPLPAGPWIMRQSWCELLFAHWPLPPDILRPLVPARLALDTFDDSAWVSVAAFRLTGLRARGLPALPGLSEFLELNLRTYVRVGDAPGVYFFSLDAASRLAVMGARIFYRLPYFHARMSMERRDGWIHYRSRRRGGGDGEGDGGGAAEFVARYRPVGPAFNALPGSLDHFLVERYALYTTFPTGEVLRADIDHPPWPLQNAEAEITRNTVAEAQGIRLPAREPRLHFAARQDTLVWPPRRTA
ncbi:MAG TPA: DUF2071 domain-containing protein [Longimicrobiales bacterium]